MTRIFSGRPAHALCNHFTRYMATQSENSVPPYPYAYDAAKNLIKAASLHGDFHYGAYWAGQGAPLSRPMRADLLMACLKQEYLESF